MLMINFFRCDYENLNLTLKMQNVSLIALWVHLPRFSLEFYDAQILEGLSSTIGVLLPIDNYTLNDERDIYA